MSVHIATLTTTEAALRGYAEFSLAQFTVGFVTKLGLNVVRDPLPEDPSHAFICPCATKGQAKAFAREAELIVVTVAPTPT